MTMTLRTVVVAVAMMCGGAKAFAADEAIRARLNQIFYWHLSDELRLNPEQERKLIQAIERVQKRRSEGLKERDASLAALQKVSKESPAATLDQALERHRKALVELGRIDAEEHDELKGLLGPALLARYYLLREDVLARVRDGLRNPAPKTR